jgi:hypothetical protein
MINNSSQWLRSHKLRFAFSLLALISILAASFIIGTTWLSGSKVHAAGTCKVDYSVQSQWSTGFTAGIKLTNTGSSAYNGWTLAFTFPNASQKVTQGWSATWTQSSQNITAKNLDWNKNIASGASTNIGFNGSFSGLNPMPTSFTINGQTCNTSVTPSPVYTFTPAPHQTITPIPSITPTPSSVSIVVQSNYQQVPARTVGTVTATCTQGQMIGGGFVTNPFETVSVQASYPSASNQWTVIAESDPSWVGVTAYAECLVANPAALLPNPFIAIDALPITPCPALLSTGFNGTHTYMMCAETTSPYYKSAPQVTKTITVTYPNGQMPIGAPSSGSISCPSGQIMTGGTVSGSGQVQNSYLISDQNTWSVTMLNVPNAAQFTITGYCIYVPML